MADTMLNQYVPDYLVPPGDVLEEYLEAYSMTQTELAARTGLTKKTINEISRVKRRLRSNSSKNVTGKYLIHYKERSIKALTPFYWEADNRSLQKR